MQTEIIYESPLRYPGGKGKWGNFMKLLFEENNLIGGDYVEPFAGGGGIALKLLYFGYANNIHLNDINKPLYAFWFSALKETEQLCAKIQDTNVTMDEWQKQKDIQLRPDEHSLVELGYSTFFLNRTNRSGIIFLGGVIGGKSQSGNWRLDARFNKKDLIKRIEKIGQHEKKIHIYNQDAKIFLKEKRRIFNKRCLVYLDPPYFVKGNRLYENHFKPIDHQNLAKQVQSMTKTKWIVSYDNVEFIRDLYTEYRQLIYDLNYTVKKFSIGTEIMFFSDGLTIPCVRTPVSVSIEKYRKTSTKGYSEALP